MSTDVRSYRIAVVLLTAALIATLTASLTGDDTADAVEGPVEVVYVATGRDYPDALAGGTLATAVGAPLLTVNTDLPLPEATIASLEALDPQRVVIFGGAAAVSEGVRGALADYTRSGAVTRIAGDDRHETAGAIADALPDKVHDSDLLDGLDSTDFSRSTHDHDDAYLATDATAGDSAALGGAPAEVYRSWPITFTRADDGAVLDAFAGPELPAAGAPQLFAYYSVPPLSVPGVENALTLSFFDFLPTGCTVRVRVWGTGAPGGGQYHNVVIPDDGGDGHATLTVPWGAFGDRGGGVVYVERQADDAVDDCGVVHVQGMHFTFGS